MNSNPWTPKELERLSRRYVEETGQQDYQHADVAKWAESKNYAMPVPPTPVDILTAMLSAAATRVKRRDGQTDWEYRALLAYPAMVQGEKKMRWFDADGPTATGDKVASSCNRRRDQALNILVSAKSTHEHHRLRHPSQAIPAMEFSISAEEVEWRLAGRRLAEEDNRKVG